VNGFSPEAQAFAEQVFRIGSWRGELPPATSLPLEGAHAMEEVVRGRLDCQPDLQLRLFGPTDDDGLETLRGHSVGFMVAGAIALGMGERGLDDDLAAGLIHIAADPDPEALLLRANLLGERLVEPPPSVIPEWLEEIERFLARTCFVGVMDAVLELGRWASSRSVSYATGIITVTPRDPCGHVKMTIAGAGFGTSQPTGVVVYVPTYGGGCREAAVESWADTAVVVRVPADIGDGCVGFAQLAEPVAELQRVTGELTSCIGPAAAVWARGFERVQTPAVSCPPCLPGGQNRIYTAGRPVINRFSFTPDFVQPGGQPTLTWSVGNASAVQIATISGPVPTLPSPLPHAGSVTLAPVIGLAPVTGQYRLIATNACGAKIADAEFSMRRIPLLSVTRIEVVQSIQTETNTVPLVAGKRTAVRVFVDSGISDGFDFGTGLGPNRVGNLHADLVAENLDTGAVTDCGYPWGGPREAGPALDRDRLGDSINFDVPLAACQGNVQFRVTVTQPGPPGSTSAPASGSVNVAFTTRGSQMFLPYLVTDPASARPRPTMADFYSCLEGPRAAHPLSENGLVINPPLSVDLFGARGLQSENNWHWLVMSLQTMTLLFASQPVGGVRMAIVPPDPTYYWDGYAIARTGAGVPTFVVKAGFAQICTHELAHAAGLLHVNDGSAGPPHGGLPLMTSDPGIDVKRRTIVRAGAWETMSYSSPQWPSIPHYMHMYASIPFA
jgi:hypothetical protein